MLPAHPAAPAPSQFTQFAPAQLTQLTQRPAPAPAIKTVGDLLAALVPFLKSNIQEEAVQGALCPSM